MKIKEIKKINKFIKKCNNWYQLRDVLVGFSNDIEWYNLEGENRPDVMGFKIIELDILEKSGRKIIFSFNKKYKEMGKTVYSWWIGCEK